jgi:hypothetical protein
VRDPRAVEPVVRLPDLVLGRFLERDLGGRRLSSVNAGAASACNVVRVSALRAFAPGIYPRSAGLVAATRDLDRGRTTAAAVAERVERDRLAFVAAQQEAGFELIVDGMLDWQDLFRPLAERCEGVEARPLTRFLDTNTFFRALLVSGTPRLREPMPVPVLPGDWLGTLPSPYALGGQPRLGRDLSPLLAHPESNHTSTTYSSYVTHANMRLAYDREVGGRKDEARGLPGRTRSPASGARSTCF